MNKHPLFATQVLFFLMFIAIITIIVIIHSTLHYTHRNNYMCVYCVLRWLFTIYSTQRVVGQHIISIPIIFILYYINILKFIIRLHISI
jgi:hypothetical protein